MIAIFPKGNFGEVFNMMQFIHILKLYVNEKAQNLVEYALLLAVVIGIGYLIYNQTGLEKDLSTIFSRAAKFIPKTAYTPEG